MGRIFIIFHPRRGPEGPEGEQNYSSTLSSTSALMGGGGGATPRPCRFTPRERDPVPIVQKAGWAPGAVLACAENLAPTGIRLPYLPGRSESLPRRTLMLQLQACTAPASQGWLFNATPRYFTHGKDQVPILQEVGWQLIESTFTFFGSKGICMMTVIITVMTVIFAETFTNKLLESYKARGRNSIKVL